MAKAEYILYSYFRSSCSARLRIMLNLKGIGYELEAVNLLKGEQLSEAHRALNPSASVPLLLARGGPDDGFRVGQSVAAMEYLEERHPDRRPTLPPADAIRARAVVRTLVHVIAADTQPVTNLRIMRRVRALGGDADAWNRALMTDGLRAYEDLACQSAGRYSVGDSITMADVCLMPAVWNAERFGVDLGAFPVVSRIADGLREHEAVLKAHPLNQPDTPDEMRTG